MVRVIARYSERAGIEPRAREKIWRAYQAHPAGLAWVIDQALDANGPSHYVGFLLAKLKHKEHLTALEAYPMGGTEAYYLCAACDGTGFLSDGAACTCAVGWHLLDYSGTTLWSELEAKYGLRLMERSEPGTVKRGQPLRAVK